MKLNFARDDHGYYSFVELNNGNNFGEASLYCMEGGDKSFFGGKIISFNIANWKCEHNGSLTKK